jgi:hypothetical protein
MLLFSHRSTKCALVFLLISTISPCYMSQNSPPECPYPCLPPPTGAANSYPPPPQLPDSFNAYPPPPPLGTNPGDMNNYYPPPPPGSMPNYYFSPPSYTYGAPPPPNPILPWFPFYYKNPPSPSRSSAHCTALTGMASSTMITVVLLGFFILDN